MPQEKNLICSACSNPLQVETLLIVCSFSGDLTALKESTSQWNNLANGLRAAIKEQPRMLQGGQLRSYQLEGLRWMVSLHDHGLNGILADEMVSTSSTYFVHLYLHGRPIAWEMRSCCFAQITSFHMPFHSSGPGQNDTDHWSDSPPGGDKGHCWTVPGGCALLCAPQLGL